MNTMMNAPTRSYQAEFIDKKELARRLNRGLRTINAWMQRGILPYYKVGYRVLFNWPEVMERLGKFVKNGGDGGRRTDDGGRADGSRGPKTEDRGPQRKRGQRSEISGQKSGEKIAA